MRRRHNPRNRQWSFSDQPPGAENSPGRLRRFYNELIEDIQIVKQWRQVLRRKEGDDAPQKRVYARFLAESDADLRRTRVDPDLSLDELLMMLGEPMSEKTNRPSCDHCTYIGACSPTLCRTKPERIVRVCTPHDGNCLHTLCFDATELTAYISPDAEGEIPNPVLQLGVTGGVPLDPKTLEPVLDVDTAAALRWQLAMWRDFGVLQGQVTVDSTELGFLRGFVLPAIAARIERMGDTMVGRWFRRITPAAVRRMLRMPANMLMYLLDHPFVMWIALWVAKIMRMVACLFVFGVDEKLVKKVRQKIMDVVNVTYQYPLLNDLIDMLLSIMECVVKREGLSCVTNIGSVMFRSVWSSMSTMAGFVNDSFATFGRVTGLWSENISNQLSRMGMMIEDGNFLQWVNIMLMNITDGRFKVGSLTDDGIDNWEVTNMVVPLHREMRDFMNANWQTLGMALAITLLRYVPLVALMKGVATIGLIYPPLLPMSIWLTTLSSLPTVEQDASVRQALIVLLRDVSMVWQLAHLYEWLTVIGQFLKCGVAAISVQLGVPDSWRQSIGVDNDRGLCCGANVLEALEEGRKHAAKLREQAKTATDLGDLTTQIDMASNASEYVIPMAAPLRYMKNMAVDAFKRHVLPTTSGPALNASWGQRRKPRRVRPNRHRRR